MATRKIVDATQNGKKVWLKGHALATFLSDGRTVEDAIKNIGNLGGSGGGATVYDFDFQEALTNSAVTQDVYDAVKAADIVTVNGLLSMKLVNEDGSIILDMMSVSIEGDVSGEVRTTVGVFELTIAADLTVLLKMASGLAPNKLSELTNDVGYITADKAPKIYHMATLTSTSGTISQEVYDAIVAADVVLYDGVPAVKYVGDDGAVQLLASYISGRLVGCHTIVIDVDLSYTDNSSLYAVPSRTSQLENDSGYITAADIPPCGLPTELVELSDTITLQEGKMLEIDITTPVTGSLTLRAPTITDSSQGLLFGIRFYCGETVPQLTLAGVLGFTGIWANGEAPQLEPNVEIEIIGCKMRGAMILLSWAVYKA